MTAMLLAILCAATDPASAAAQLRQQALELHQQQRFEDALPLLWEAYHLSHDPRFHVTIGETYWYLGRLPEALGAFDRALREIDGTDPAAAKLRELTSFYQRELGDQLRRAAGWRVVIGADVEPRFRGAGVNAGLVRSLWGHLGVGLRALVRPAEGQPVFGGAPAVNVGWSWGRWTPRAELGLPLYWDKGVRPAISGALGFEVDLGARWQLIAEITVERSLSSSPGLRMPLLYPTTALARRL